MPGSDNYDVSILPRGYPMCVSLIVHVGEGLELHFGFVQDRAIFKISLGVCNSATAHVNLASHLDRLLVPQGPKAFVAESLLALGHFQDIKCH